MKWQLFGTDTIEIYSHLLKELRRAAGSTIQHARMAESCLNLAIVKDQPFKEQADGL